MPKRSRDSGLVTTWPGASRWWAGSRRTRRELMARVVASAIRRALGLLVANGEPPGFEERACARGTRFERLRSVVGTIRRAATALRIAIDPVRAAG